MKKTLLALTVFLILMLLYAPAKGNNSLRIVVNKSYHLLFIKDGDEIVHVVPVTIGTGGESETPNGNFSVVSIVHNPNWYFNGKTYLPYIEDPNNGLGVCWMGISLPSYGIHGTNEPFSPGRNRSHGCVRMNNNDILRTSEISFIGEKVQIEEGINNNISKHLKTINLLYDMENFLNSAK